MKICIDLDKCAGLGMCEAFAPDVFEVQPGGKVRVAVDSPGEELRAVVEEAAAGCPTEAIGITE
ncbi:ferredoxin [Saccharopolyspora shandongensis]|uniref:ferredoxin n=1 Tax=Saccharopolyspora shandongensis TaxID=418495 RepID=UPI0033E8B2D2